MTEQLRVIDLDSKYNRAIFIGTGSRDTYFALAIRRNYQTISGFYWCFYLGLSEQEWTLAVNRQSDEFSFLSVPNLYIMVPDLVAQKYIMEAPDYYIGNHLTREQVGDSSEEIGAALQKFVESAYAFIYGDSHADRKTA